MTPIPHQLDQQHAWIHSATEDGTASQPLSRWNGPLVIGLGLSIGFKVGHEFEGDDRALPILYGSVTSAIAALIVVSMFGLLPRCFGNDATPGTEGDPLGTADLQVHSSAERAG